MIHARVLLVALMAGAACQPAPSADPEPVRPGAGEALVHSCCPFDDAAIMEVMRRYEATAESARTPELALVPYRMTSGITRRDRIVIRDAAEWARVWPEVVGSHSPKPPLPAVDFARETIVLASMGQRSAGGYVVRIDSAGVAGDTVILAVTERSPGPTCGTTAALSSPIALARVMRANATIRFVEKTDASDCG